MERQYTVKMTVTIDDEIIGETTPKDVILNALEEAPFQVDCILIIGSDHV